jgi:hypothetical protein
MAASDDMLITRPPRWPWIMAGSTALVTRKTPVALTSSVRRQASSAICATGEGPKIAPALLTRISMRPNSAITWASIAWIEAGSVTSTWTGRQRTLCCGRSSSCSSSCCGRSPTEPRPISAAIACSSSHWPMAGAGRPAGGGAHRSAMATSTPAWARRRAIAAPMPPWRPAPVIRAILLLFGVIGIVLSLLVRHYRRLDR